MEISSLQLTQIPRMLCEMKCSSTQRKSTYFRKKTTQVPQSLCAWKSTAVSVVGYFFLDFFVFDSVLYCLLNVGVYLYLMLFVGLFDILVHCSYITCLPRRRGLRELYCMTYNSGYIHCACDVI